MATKKRTKKKHRKLKKTTAKKARPVKKRARKRVAKKKAAPKKKPVSKKTVVKTRPLGKKTVRKKTEIAKPADAVKKPSRSVVQSGDLQGLSNVEAADSESVGELIEEGNAFEAEVVAGVEDAGSRVEREVRTHEVPEDDVPDEYLDKD